MKYGILMIAALSVCALSVPAHAETEQQATTENGSKIIKTFVGYDEEMIGNVIVKGSTGQPGQAPQNFSMDNIYQLLDQNRDGALTQTEMFRFNTATPRKKGTRSNLVTSTGRPIKVDYYTFQDDGASAVIVEDLTADGSFFEKMDVNGDAFVTREEFSFDIIQDEKPSDIMPATGGAPLGSAQ